MVVSRKGAPFLYNIPVSGTSVCKGVFTRTAVEAFLFLLESADIYVICNPSGGLLHVFLNFPSLIYLR